MADILLAASSADDVDPGLSLARGKTGKADAIRTAR
jgi:hypothetical protein